MIKRINVFALVMLITGAIDSIRNLPATSLFGTELIFFCIFAAIIFLIPTALVAADLSSKLPEHGGVYRWSRLAFGEHVGFLTVWLQWINTMVWYPTILSFIAGTLAYLINPALAHDKFYLVVVILAVFWGLTLLNFRGLHVSAHFAEICTLLGMVVPMIAIILLALFWIFTGHTTQIHFTVQNILPHVLHAQSWISLTAIMAAFLGMELAAVHVGQVRRAQHNFPKALGISVAIILVTMIMGSLAIAIVLPAKKVSLVSGVIQAVAQFLQVYHLHWLLPVFVIMIFIGALGGMINWIISPAKGLLQAGQQGFLPHWLRKENKHGVAQNLLIVQAILVSVVCLAFLVMPSVNGSYWFLTDLSTQLYMLMYIIMFMSAMVLGRRYANVKAPFKIPGGVKGIRFMCYLGVFGTIVSILVGFIPPTTINVGSTFHYELSFALGMVVMVLPVLGFYAYRAFSQSRH